MTLSHTSGLPLRNVSDIGLVSSKRVQIHVYQFSQLKLLIPIRHCYEMNMEQVYHCFVVSCDYAGSTACPLS
jgi:hypothetical protein